MTSEEKLKSSKKILKTNLQHLLIKRAFDLGYITEQEKTKIETLKTNWQKTYNYSFWVLYVNVLYSKVNKKNKI